jgi:hypothetical protein
MLSIVIAASIIDTSIIKLSVFTGGMAPLWNIVTFSMLVVIYALGQFIILRFITRKIEISKISSVYSISNVISTIQYFLIAVLVFIILQMIFTSSYSLILLEIVVWTNCGLSIILLGYLSKKFFSWFLTNRDIIVITYALAMGTLVVNIFFLAVFFTVALNNHEDKIQYSRSLVTSVNNVSNVFNLVYVVSSVLSFIFIWLATVLLLRYYSKKIGTAKYWIIVTAPLFYFLSQFQSTLLDLFDSFRISDPILFGIIFTLIFTMSKPIGGILFGIAFWIASRKVTKYAVKDYLIVSAFGVVLLFTSNQITMLIFVPYPPFGLVTASLIGLSSYMLLIGIYSSAMSVSRDTELRKFIHTVAEREIEWLDRIGSAQREHELLTKVIPLVQNKAHSMEQETGIEISFSDADMMHYLNDVLIEIRNSKKE